MIIRTVQDIPEEIKNIVERFYLTDADSAIQASHAILHDNPEMDRLLVLVKELVKDPPDSIFMFYDELISRYNSEPVECESVSGSDDNASISDVVGSGCLDGDLFGSLTETANADNAVKTDDLIDAFLLDRKGDEKDLFSEEPAGLLDTERLVIPEDPKQVSDGFNSLLRDVVSQKNKEMQEEACKRKSSFESDLNRALNDSADGDIKSSEISLDIDVDFDFDLSCDLPDSADGVAEAVNCEIAKPEPVESAPAVPLIEIPLNESAEEKPVFGFEAAEDAPFGEIDISLSGDVEALEDDLKLDLPVLNIDDVLNEPDGKGEFEPAEADKLDAAPLVGEEALKPLEFVDSPTVTPFCDNNPVEIGVVGNSLPEHISDDAFRSVTRVPPFSSTLASTDSTPVPIGRYSGSFMKIDEAEHSEKVTTPKLMPIEEGEQPQRNRASTIGGFRTGEYFKDIVSRPTATNLTPVSDLSREAVVSSGTSNSGSSVSTNLPPISKKLSGESFKSVTSLGGNVEKVLGGTRGASLYEKTKPTSITLSPVMPSGVKPAVPSNEQNAVSKLRPLTRIPRLICSMSELSQHSTMNPRAGFLISLIDGHTSISDIIDISAWQDTETAGLLLELEAQQIIAFE